jgi:hypothetical protein
MTYIKNEHPTQKDKDAECIATDDSLGQLAGCLARKQGGPQLLGRLQLASWFGGAPLGCWYEEVPLANWRLRKCNLGGAEKTPKPDVAAVLACLNNAQMTLGFEEPLLFALGGPQINGASDQFTIDHLRFTVSPFQFCASRRRANSHNTKR